MEPYDQAVSCVAVNSALLFCLNEQPAAPKQHSITSDITQPQSGLSLQRETQLADDFAFVSSMKYDPNRVTGICIERDADHLGLTFRVASNTGDLTNTVQQLQAVANIMMQASRRGKSDLQTTAGLCLHSE